MTNARSSSDVLLFSQDSELIDLIANDQIVATESGEQRPAYTVWDSSVIGVGDSPVDSSFDVVLFDVDMVNGDWTQVRDCISHLNPQLKHTPLILIGHKPDLDRLRADAAINAGFDRSVVKPVLMSKLLLAIGLICPAGSEPTEPTSQQAQRPDKGPVRIGIAVGMVVLVLITVFMTMDKPEPVELPVVETPINAPRQRQDPAVTDQREISEIENLSELAQRAESLGRHYTPERENALFYFDQILKLDDYHQGAYEGRQRMLKELRLSILQSFEGDDLSRTQSLLNLMEQAEPYSDSVRQMRRMLEARVAEQLGVQPTDEEAYIGVKSNGDGDVSSWGIVGQAENITAVVDNNEPEAPTVRETQVVTTSAITQAEMNADRNFATPVNVASFTMDQQPVTTISPAVVVKRVDAEYPSRAYQFDLQGWVELEYQVNTEGLAFNIRVIDSKPKKIFDKAAVQALEKWQFEPARSGQDGKAVISETTTAKFNFELDG